MNEQNNMLVELRNENTLLKAQIEVLKAEIERLKKRGAGRKVLFNAYQISNIKNARKTGKTYRAIADKYNCSPSLVYKLVNKQ